MTVDKDYLLDIASEFSAIDTTRVDRLVAIAELEVGETAWGERRDIGVAYLVAHRLKVDANRGSGAVVEETAKDLTLRYAAPGDGDLGTTAYGREYQRLKSTIFATPLVT